MSTDNLYLILTTIDYSLTTNLIGQSVNRAIGQLNNLYIKGESYGS
jgi:hypothetical protein